MRCHKTFDRQQDEVEIKSAHSSNLFTKGRVNVVPIERRTLILVISKEARTARNLGDSGRPSRRRRGEDCGDCEARA
jgi:hypothetical protein